METKIDIKKRRLGIWITERDLGIRFYNVRKVSVMTDELLKLEWRIRVLSFRPTFMDECIYLAKSRILEDMVAQEKWFWGLSPELKTKNN